MKIFTQMMMIALMEMILTTTDFIKCFAYYRISPNPRKNSPEENQISEIRKYAVEKSLEIIGEYKDILVSGTEMNRPQFNDMLNSLQKVKGIIIYDVSRFGRNAKEAIPLFMDLLNKGIKIYLVKNNICLDYSQGSKMSIWDMLLPIIEFFQAEEYVKNLHKRQKIGINRYIEKNGKWGRNSKKVKWSKYVEWRMKGLNKSAACVLLEISTNTLYRRFRDLFEEYDSLREIGLTEEEILIRLHLENYEFAQIMSDFQHLVYAGETKE